MKTMSKILVLLLVGLIGIGIAPFRDLAAYSASMSEEDKLAIKRAEQQMEDISNQAEELAKEQQRIASEQKTVLGEMKQLSNQIGVLEKEIKELDGQIKDREGQIEVLVADIEVKSGEVAQRNQYFDERLNQIYRDGDISALDVLFASSSLTDFLTRYDLMQRVVENDIDLLTGLREAKMGLEGQKAALEEAKAGLEEEKSARQEKSTDLNRQWSKQRSMSRELEADMALAMEAEDELNALSKKLEKFIADTQAKYKAAYMGSGTLAWPVPGYSRISSYYGYRIHPIYKVNRFHTGIDIPANSGTTVIASETGNVIMATTYGGFGKTVILDHGGGVATQYSHLSSISVSQGQRVYKGDKVGGVGTTGLSTGNHLHFQIMIDGATVDPLSNGKYYVSPK
jgi:murein DD-endopeptidase MepM/ murein hydrolase activator NlpD